MLLDKLMGKKDLRHWMTTFENQIADDRASDSSKRHFKNFNFPIELCSREERKGSRKDKKPSSNANLKTQASECA